MFGELFDDLRSEFGAMRDELRHGTQTRTLTVAKPYCSPARDIVMTALQPYGVRIYGYSEHTEKTELRGFLRRMKIEAKTFENLRYGPAAAGWLPMAIVAEVTVSEKAAAWAEYLMLRTGKLYVPGEYVNKRNADWARQHGGEMPPRWNEQPWIERSCSDGMNAWSDMKRAMQSHQISQKRR